MAKRKLPEILTTEEISLILKSFNVRSKTNYRNKLLIEFALKTGMRISELINLKWSDVDLASGKIHIKEGKGKKDRIIFINPIFFNELIIMNKAYNLKENVYIFPNYNGESLNSKYLQRMIKDRGDKLCFKKRLYFHLLRHTALTEIYQETKNIRLVQEIAGHENINTTMIYTHISGAEIKEIMTKRNKKY